MGYPKYMNVNIKVFLVDGDESFRSRLKSLLIGESDMAVVGEAGDGETALERLRATSPDVISMAIRMPGIDGVETGRRLLQLEPGRRSSSLPDMTTRSTWLKRSSWEPMGIS